MGLDMYLLGEEHRSTFDARKNKKGEFPISFITYELGYWRKHPNLHGYIVQTFADGVDECQRIPLNEEALQKTLKAVEEDQLPDTTGFFFGHSTPDRKAETVEILKGAIEWLRKTPELQDPKDWRWREVYYRASW